MQFAQDVAALYADFRGRIYRYLRRLTQDEGLAEDLTQETFLRAGKYLNTFRGEGDIGNWLSPNAPRIASSPSVSSRTSLCRRSPCVIGNASL
jgi:DNA-directed RNA polymerase specialized sigma24 family protein